MQGKALLGLLMIVLLAGGSAAAAEEKAQAQEPPSMELLEFLGQWQTDDGEWIDPTALERMVIPEQEQRGSDDEKP